MSSDNYAGRLSEYPNKGVCGLPESIDSARTLDYKVPKLLNLIRNSKHIVVLSGAGISTSAGIPDFRGSNGIWTQEESTKKKQRKSKKENITKTTVTIKSTSSNRKKRKEQADCDENDVDVDVDEKYPQTQSQKRIRMDHSSTNKDLSTSTKAEVDADKSSTSDHSFETAIPTITHRSITRLVEMGIIKYVITQNVDGLHRRSGLLRSKHAILHGCIFTEKCEVCGEEYFRKFDVGGVSFQKTGRKCDKDGCNGDLRDTILDWEDELPEIDWSMSQEQCAKSDLVLALGTSLRIEPGKYNQKIVFTKTTATSLFLHRKSKVRNYLLFLSL